MSKETKTRPYFTRNFRHDLHKRLKIYAASREQEVTLEEALNIVVEVGLGVVENELRDRN